MLNLTIIVALFIPFIADVNCFGSRFRRQYSVDYRSNIPACDVVCEAQWKSEFQMNFQKLYDTEYFEVPLDTTITRNRASLKTFCSSTNQKYSCLRRECHIHRTPWSPEKHICLAHFDDFERNINCLGLTDRYVQKECTSVCNGFKIEISKSENEKMDELEFSKNERSTFLEQNQHCTFIACHQMCHEYIINKICIDSAASSRSVVRNYYDAYLEREYNSLRKIGHDYLYSSFCRRVTPGQDENSISSNMTRFNNNIMDRMKSDIRNIFLILD